MIVVVVAVAANGDRLAGVLAQRPSAAVSFDFFLTQPYERFSITSRNDIETTVLLLVIGVAVTELAVWGRHQHAAASRRARLPRRNRQCRAGRGHGPLAVRADGAGDRPAHRAAGAAMVPVSVRRRRAGPRSPGWGMTDPVAVEQRIWDVDAKGFPPGMNVELLVESGGLFQGRFLMSPDDGRASHARAAAARGVALADQVGAALATSRPATSDRIGRSRAGGRWPRGPE